MHVIDIADLLLRRLTNAHQRRHRRRSTAAALFGRLPTCLFPLWPPSLDLVAIGQTKFLLQARHGVQ
jgi:hypothetical protein